MATSDLGLGVREIGLASRLEARRAGRGGCREDAEVSGRPIAVVKEPAIRRTAPHNENRGHRCGSDDHDNEQTPQDVDPVTLDACALSRYRPEWLRALHDKKTLDQSFLMLTTVQPLT